MATEVTWHQEAFGKEDAPRVLFLHGFMGCGAVWRPIAGALGGAFHCICPDLPYHGRTRLPGENADGLTFESVAEAIADRYSPQCAGECGLVGYSMGGRIAMYLALRYPEQFSRAVIESASPGIAEVAARAERRAHDARLAARLKGMPAGSAVFRQFLEEWYALPLWASLAARPHLRDALIRQRLENDPARLADALRALGSGMQPSLWDRVPECRRPMLMVAGARDARYRHVAERVAELSPRIAVHEMADCGHNVHAENPDGYTTVLRAFLET